MPVTAVRTVVLAGHVRPSGPKVCSIGGSVCVHPVLRSTHLASLNLQDHLISCSRTAVYLPSDHPHLQGAAAAMPGRAFVLRDKEFGEAAQAPERSRFNGSKRKVQVCGDL